MAIHIRRRELIVALSGAAAWPLAARAQQPAKIPRIGNVTALEVRRAADIAPAFEASKDRADALYLCGEAFVVTHRTRIVSLALIARWPIISGFRELVHEGSLMSYGPSIPDLFRRSAELVDKILRGAKAAEIPVEQPVKFDLIINLATAKALGLTVPPMLLARADEVIE